VLILDAMRRHENPNPSLIQSASDAFRRVSPPGSVCQATRWDLESAADAHQPELILAISSRIWAELAPALGILRERYAATVGWWLTDDPDEIDPNLEWAPAFDFVASNDLGSVQLYHATAVFHAALAADSRRHFRALRRDDAAYERDLFFSGAADPNRRAWIEKALPLLSRYQTLLAGPDWSDLPIPTCKGVENHALADLYNSSRIVLNLPRARNHSAFSNRCNRHNFPPSTPAPRTFEAAAAGGFQLVSADRPELHQYFQVPEEMDLFVNLCELEAKIDWYLAHPQERIAAAQRAQFRTMHEHTYDRRAEALLLQVQALRAARAGAAAPPAAESRPPHAVAA
jgi:spore maturation protein CgeB